MSWSLQGDFYENCSCEAICPCTWSNLAHQATRDDYCRFALAFDVESGDIEGVDVSGQSFVMIADTPPNMADGNWRVGVIVDDRLKLTRRERRVEAGHAILGCLVARLLPRVRELRRALAERLVVLLGFVGVARDGERRLRFLPARSVGAGDFVLPRLALLRGGLFGLRCAGTDQQDNAGNQGGDGGAQ